MSCASCSVISLINSVSTEEIDKLLSKSAKREKVFSKFSSSFFVFKNIAFILIVSLFLDADSLVMLIGEIS